MADTERQATVRLKAKVDFIDVLSAVGLLEMVGRLEQVLDGEENTAPDETLWIAVADWMTEAWAREIKAHGRTRAELTARIDELQAALAMQAGE